MANEQLERFNPLAGRRFREAAVDLADDDGALPMIGEDGSMRVGAITLLPTGLRIAGSIDESEWLKIGGVLRKLQNSLQWLIGDWLVYGEREYGKTYDEIAALFGYKVETLYQFKWVANQVKISLRGEKLDFGHYKLIAGLEPAEQRHWLRLAEAMNPRPTVRQFAALIQGMALPAPAKGVAKLAQNEMVVRTRFEKAARTKKPDQREHLRQFAEVQAEYWKSAVEALSKGE